MFTNASEIGARSASLALFLLEIRGRFEGAQRWLPSAVNDGNLSTGQMPQPLKQWHAMVLRGGKHIQQNNKMCAPVPQ